MTEHADPAAAPGALDLDALAERVARIEEVVAARGPLQAMLDAMGDQARLARFEVPALIACCRAQRAEIERLRRALGEVASGEWAADENAPPVDVRKAIYAQVVLLEGETKLRAANAALAAERDRYRAALKTITGCPHDYRLAQAALAGPGRAREEGAG